ncbi:cytochrome P450 [Infundibulicybe gibba]|nr:cytochrome P450 [Infundibulicybe gibba]
MGYRDCWNTVSKHFPAQTRGTKLFLLRLLKSPQEFRDHIRHTFAATIMDVTYGIKVKEKNDSYVETVETSLEGIVAAGVPGAFLVDFMPILKYVPGWMPGAGFKRKAAYWRDANYKTREKPWRFVESQHSQGIAPDSMAAAFFDGLPPIGDEQREIEEAYARDTAAQAFVAGADTILSSFQAFFLAMALYPEAQRKAQAELDSVVGNNRLPEFADRNSLPYECYCEGSNEVAQCYPTSHSPYDYERRRTRWLFYSEMIDSLWQHMIYDQPSEFRPERFLKDGEIDPSVPGAEVASFGFGRRICPVSSVLSVFTISPAKDEYGNTIPIHPGATSGLVSYPAHFDCEIKPRSAAAEKLIRDSQELI